MSREILVICSLELRCGTHQRSSGEPSCFLTPLDDPSPSLGGVYQMGSGSLFTLLTLRVHIWYIDAVVRRSSSPGLVPLRREHWGRTWYMLLRLRNKSKDGIHR